ncbi:pyrroline-5-carboxylate reductase dimerization domain-containing protein [Alicyclobacillus dauci]|uniref:NAD(P)-binding domain-containing protein n=1 Tax=Alicyclobacillus dauci TaxID=1475485 RepID=A0ABY6Z1D1_9BACL|nr:pyrroline-5-carboxylate reductase dimerization domain-containing protein [Alicyclobacillus dauci]WAH36388.1 NAD(P)-binding domain-containing protein [Alicyclobacillus dauci]
MTKAKTLRRWRPLQIGIIGTGHMGGMLARAFAQTATDDIYIYNRSRPKADAVAASFPNIIVCDDWRSLIARANTAFLCTKAADGINLATQMAPYLNSEHMLVTTISTIDLDRWRDLTPATPVKLIPSLTQTANKGVMLLSYPRHMPVELQQQLESRLSQIGKPFTIDEGQVRVCSDLASCGPAFLATICRAWSQAAAQTASVDRATAEQLIREMLIGLAALLESGMQFEDVIEQISIPGGVTECGIRSMEDLPQNLFARVHAETARHATRGHRPPIGDSVVSPRQ